MNIALTKKELASIAGYSYRRLHDIDAALPSKDKLFVRSETEPKKYDLALFVQHWAKYNAEATEEENEELAVVKAQHEKVKKEKTELEVARMKSEMVNINDVHQLWADIAGIVRERFIHLGRKVGPSLVMIDNVEQIAATIDREVRDALSFVANTPLPGETYIPAENTAGEGQDDGE